MQTSIRYLKDHLSEVLKIVQCGEEVNITFHHRAIAKIIPINPLPNVTYEAKQFIEELTLLQSSLKTKRFSSIKKTIIDTRKKERY